MTTINDAKLVNVNKPTRTTTADDPKPVNMDNPWTCACGYYNEYGGMICGSCGVRP
ncbi:hypothetical protein ACHAQA_000604 [Verticillium albo-atrum]